MIGTDTLVLVLPHTLDIKNGLLFTEGGVSRQLHRMDAALSGRVFHRGSLFDSPIFRGGAPLHDTYGGWPVDAIKWPFGGPYSVCREHRLGSGPDDGGSVRLENSSSGF